MRYGFRVYEAGLRRGAFGQTPLDWSEPSPGSAPFLDTMEALLKDLQTRERTLSCIPNLQRPGEDPTDTREGDPQMRVLEFDRHAPNRLSMKVRYGFRGEFDAAFGDEASDEVDLVHRTAGSVFRVEVVAPDGGYLALMAVETVEARCPITMITRWLGRAGYEANLQDWIKVVSHQVTDAEHIRRLIRDSDRVEVKLSKRGPQMDGGRRAKPTVLTTELVSEISKSQAFAEALRWASGEGSDGKSPVQRIEEIAGLSTEQLDELGLRFEDAALIVTDSEKKRPKTIKPEKIRAMFTYPLGNELRPDDYLWERAVVEKLRALSEGLNMVVE